jgi:hypothetical protein
MRVNKFTKGYRTQYIHVALDIDVKEKLDGATGRFSVHSKTKLINSLLQGYFQAVDKGEAQMKLP